MAAYLYRELGVVFVRVPKTGVTSVTRGMLPTPSDERFSGPVPDHWAHLRSFACIRHPYERMRSALDHFRHHKLARSPEEIAIRKTLDAHAVLDIVADDAIPITGPDYLARLKMHALPMTHESLGLDRVTKLFKSDDFPAMWARVAKWLDVPKPALAHQKRARSRTELTREERRAVRNAYAADFERFGYRR